MFEKFCTLLWQECQEGANAPLTFLNGTVDFKCKRWSASFACATEQFWVKSHKRNTRWIQLWGRNLNHLSRCATRTNLCQKRVKFSRHSVIFNAKLIVPHLPAVLRLPNPIISRCRSRLALKHQTFRSAVQLFWSNRSVSTGPSGTYVWLGLQKSPRFTLV